MKGDFTPGKTIRVRFNTHKADGTPITLAGSPAISVYKGSTTESTSGVTLTVDYDSRTGLHDVVIDTSADGTFYAAGNDFDVVITVGTVDSISVVGTVVGSFSLSNRSALRPTTADRTLDVSAGGEAGLDWNNIGTTSAAVNLSATTISITQSIASVSGAVGSVAGNVSGSMGSLAAQAKADVNAEVDTALIDINLDHLLAVTAVTGDVVNNSIIARLTSKSGTPSFSSYTNTTDSLEALRDRGDAAWITATGFSTHTAADVWAVATRVLTAGTNIVLDKGTGITGFNDLSAAQVNAEADTALADYDAPTHAEMTAELATADDATLAAIAALNNLSQANVRTAVGLASANLDTQLAAIAGYIDTEVGTLVTSVGAGLNTLVTAIKAKTDNLPASPAAVGSAMVLSSTGLDAIAIPEPTTVPTTFPGWFMWLVRRFAPKGPSGKVTIPKSGNGSLIVYASDGTTVITTQTVSDDATTQTLGKVS